MAAQPSESDRSPTADWGPTLSAAVGQEYPMAEFDFNPGGMASDQGWVARDRTAQVAVFTHVASAAELNGGIFGALVPISGLRSLWCGTGPGYDNETCNYAALPGYGNGWDQRFTSIPFEHTGDVDLSYLIRFDIEPGYDRMRVQYRDKNGDWQALPVNGGQYLYDGNSGGQNVYEQLVIADSVLADSVQVRFWFTSNFAWSGQDGLWPTDGAYLLDSLTVEDDGGVLSFQDFEAEADGALQTNDGHWVASGAEYFGDFSGLYPGVTLVQDGGCPRNSSAIWAFINNSMDTYACGGYPGQAAVPSVSGDGLYIWNEIWSPPIDWDQDIGGNPIPATATRVVLEFDVYRDLPVDNLVFYVWHVRSIFAGCPSTWRDDEFVYYDDDETPDWFHARFEIGHHIQAGLDELQLAIGVRDMCDVWCNIFGTGGCHSHAPLIDNVRLSRLSMAGPIWSVKSTDLFQDNFAEDGTTTGTVRMDCAARDDNAAFTDPDPGDSVRVLVTEPAIGVDFHVPGNPASGPAVYCHVKDVSGGKSGAAISGDPSKYPVVSTGAGWTVLQFDSVFIDYSWGPEFGGFAVDLNDNLYTPGDTICYYFSARDADGNTNYWTRFLGETDLAGALATPMEVTCLPANALTGQTDVLYIDDADGFGVQPYFDTAFDVLGIRPDRYDVLAPTSFEQNGPGARVKDVVVQLASRYRKIIWSSGSLSAGLIGDGYFGSNPALSEDFTMLFTFLDESTNGPGLYITGDNNAAEWDQSTGAAQTLRSTYMNFSLVGDDHVAAGEPLSPLVIGQANSCFEHAGVADTLVGYAGCPILAFDVLQPTGSASLEMAYSGNPAHGAVVGQITQNGVGDTARVVLSGFSYHTISDDVVAFPTDRVEHLLDILRWLDNDLGEPTGVPEDAPQAYKLSQNYPNPFNPTTAIHYSLATKAHVRIDIYDVAGRRVRTLVDQVQAPQAGGRIIHWNGLNASGQSVASGVYYYRLASGAYVNTKKMVLLR